MLLASAASGGTIATVRHLAAHNIDVRVVSSHRLGAAAWSRHAACAYSAPPEKEGQRFIERLLAIGATDPGQILLATSDETAWLYAENTDQLRQHFRLYQPSIAILRRILDKKLFADAAISAGLTVLPSWDPRDIDDVAALAPTLTYPILIKPRTHVHRLRNDKGVVVHSAPDLISEYQRFIDRERTRGADSSLLPDAGLPILQQFVRVGSEGVHSVTGFIDRTGELFVTRCATKVFQRSRPVESGFALNRCRLPLCCQKPFVVSVVDWVISEFSRLSFCGSVGGGRQSISTRACFISSAWISTEVCRFRFSPCSTLRGRPRCYGRRLQRRGRRSMVKRSFTTASRCERYFSLRPSPHGYRMRIAHIGVPG